MAKPIFVVQIPHSQRLTGEQVSTFDANLYKKLHGEYHILIVSSNTDDIRFDCFNDKDLREEDFVSYHNIIMDMYKQIIDATV